MQFSHSAQYGARGVTSGINIRVGHDAVFRQKQRRCHCAAGCHAERAQCACTEPGTTSKRTVLNASVAITPISEQQLEMRSPRTSDDVLQMVPGIVVEGAAAPVSNNYSVRGLPGGG